MELGSAEAIEMAVELGIGIAFFSRLAAERGLELRHIADVKVESMKLTRDIHLTHSKGSPSTRARVEFWNFVSGFEYNAENGRPRISCEEIK